MAKAVTKKAEKVEIKVGAEKDVVMSQNLKTKIEAIKETKEDKKEEVSLVAPTKQIQTTKMVKVMLAVPHRCHIGGEWYAFQPNKQYNVPEQVKKTLMKAGLLLPL